MEERWCTIFGQWIQDFGVDRVSTEIQVSPNAVYEWVAGRTAPSPDRAQELVRLSGGSLSLEDVYRHRREVRNRS